MSSKAIGFLECAGMGAALYAIDKACKCADVKVIGIDTINPKDTSAFIPLTTQVKFEGSVSDINAALAAAESAALELNQTSEVLVSSIDLPYKGTQALGYISKINIKNNK